MRGTPRTEKKPKRDCKERLPLISPNDLWGARVSSINGIFVGGALEGFRHYVFTRVPSRDRLPLLQPIPFSFSSNLFLEGGQVLRVYREELDDR